MDAETIERISEIRRLAGDIEECLKENKYAEENQHAVIKISRLCAEVGSLDYFVGEKAGYLRADVKIFFSTKKHELHGGAEEVRRRIKMYLDAIKSRANNLERKPD